MQRTGMDAEFEMVFEAVGWENFWEIGDEGCALLTMEFLMTLHVTNESHVGTLIHFCLFGTEHVIPPCTLSNLLGFSPRCSSVDSQDFVTREFWEEITGKAGQGKHSITLIHNPTLRFLARWIASIVYP